MNGPNEKVTIKETETEEIDIESGDDDDHGTPQGETAPGGPGHGTPQTIRRS
jgi:hypothetical protein